MHPRIEIYRTAEFKDWYLEQSPKTRVIMDARLERIQNEGHFGTTNRFAGLIELKWASGMRVYTHLHQGRMLLILLGGNKNGQDKDIKRAQKILQAILAQGLTGS